MSDITKQSLSELVENIKNKKISSSEATKAFVERSEKSKELNAYITEDYANALNKAKQFDEKPNLDLKLPGIPMAVKDLFCTKDLKTTIIPRRGYTMEDIGKLDKRIDKLEEATTLSLLELSATNERLFDSSGNERLHTGFFVDNFKNQKFTDTKSLEHRASQDPTKGLIRPTYACETIPMLFDSAHSISTGVTQKGDNVYLNHTEVQYLSQTMASQTINVNPFHVEKTFSF